MLSKIISFSDYSTSVTNQRGRRRKFTSSGKGYAVLSRQGGQTELVQMGSYVSCHNKVNWDWDFYRAHFLLLVVFDSPLQSTISDRYFSSLTRNYSLSLMITEMTTLQPLNLVTCPYMLTNHVSNDGNSHWLKGAMQSYFTRVYSEIFFMWQITRCYLGEVAQWLAPRICSANR